MLRLSKVAFKTMFTLLILYCINKLNFDKYCEAQTRQRLNLFVLNVVSKVWEDINIATL